MPPAKDRPPSFQFYPRDFLSSQKVSAMTLEQIGAYTILLCHAWLSDQPGTLPDDQKLLEALSRANGRWTTISPGVLAAWSSDGGRITQPRMVEERSAQRRRLQRSIHGGKLRASGKRDSLGRLTSSLASSPTPPLASASASASAEEEKSTPPPQTAHRARLVAEGFAALITNTGEEWQATPEEIAAWIAAYPAVEIKSTFNEMRAWLIANPTKRKTLNGMPRFVNSWLAREQNRP